jgi:hypothetical protein
VGRPVARVVATAHYRLRLQGDGYAYIEDGKSRMKRVRSQIPTVAADKVEKALILGSFESHPAVFHPFEAWVRIFEWCELGASELMFGADVMTKADFEKTWPSLPPLPRHAFTRFSWFPVSDETLARLGVPRAG